MRQSLKQSVTSQRTAPCAKAWYQYFINANKINIVWLAFMSPLLRVGVESTRGRGRMTEGEERKVYDNRFLLPGFGFWFPRLVRLVFTFLSASPSSPVWNNPLFYGWDWIQSETLAEWERGGFCAREGFFDLFWALISASKRGFFR